MIKAIKIMMDEHKNILKTLKVARKMCQEILINNKCETKDFYKLIDFIRNYADKHHHGKEESILFKIMGEELGPNVTDGPIRGMLIEHDLGRLYMSRLEEALKEYEKGEQEALLDIIANTISYTHLLQHHINTEDNTLYPFAEKRLRKETIEKLEEEVGKLENNRESEDTRKKYNDLANELAKKYIL